MKQKSQLCVHRLFPLFTLPPPGALPTSGAVIGPAYYRHGVRPFFMAQEYEIEGKKVTVRIDCEKEELKQALIEAVVCERARRGSD